MLSNTRTQGPINFNSLTGSATKWIDRSADHRPPPRPHLARRHVFFLGGAILSSIAHPNAAADKPGGGSWAAYSDGRLKNVDGSFISGLDKVMKLRPVRYRYKVDNALGIRDHEEHIGVVAQEVQQVLPEAVTENNKGYLLVNNDPIIWAMLNAIKEQQQEIRTLRKRAVRLESKLTALQKQRGQIEVASVK